MQSLPLKWSNLHDLSIFFIIKPQLVLCGNVGGFDSSQWVVCQLERGFPFFWMCEIGELHSKKPRRWSRRVSHGVLSFRTSLSQSATVAHLLSLRHITPSEDGGKRPLITLWNFHLPVAPLFSLPLAFFVSGFLWGRLDFGLSDDWLALHRRSFAVCPKFTVNTVNTETICLLWQLCSMKEDMEELKSCIIKDLYGDTWDCTLQLTKIVVMLIKSRYRLITHDDARGTRLLFCSTLVCA